MQTQDVGVMQVDQLGDTVQVAAALLVDPAVDVVGGDLQPSPHPAPRAGQIPVEASV